MKINGKQYWKAARERLIKPGTNGKMKSEITEMITGGNRHVSEAESI